MFTLTNMVMDIILIFLKNTKILEKLDLKKLG